MNWYIAAIVLAVLVSIVSLIEIWQQYKQYKALEQESNRAKGELEMSKKREKNEVEELKKMLDSFEKELNAELERELGNIMGAENPFEALMNLGKEPKLDPIKDFDHPSMMKKPEDEKWQ